MANKYMKKCSTSLVTKAVKIKKTLRDSISPLAECQLLRKQTTKNVGNDVEEKELLYTVGGNVNWRNHHGNQYGGL
jgi:hypothetical protein